MKHKLSHRSTNRPLRVFMVIDFFDRHGGASGVLVATALLLSASGCEISVFSEKPIDRDNQYVNALTSAGIPVSCPEEVWHRMTERLELSRLILWLLIPIRIPIALVDMVHRHRTFRRSWQGVRGALHWHLPHRPLINLVRCRLYWLLTTKHRERRPDIVHIGRGATGLRWSAAVKLPRLYVENSIPSSDLALDWWDELRHTIHLADAVVSVCEPGAKAVTGHLGYKGPVFVIPNFTSDPTLDPSYVRKIECEDKEKISYVIGTAGRLDREKGHAHLIQALHLLRQHEYEAVELWIAGDGPERKHLEAQAAEAGLADRVKFLGHLNPGEMTAFMRRIDIFVLPSLLEAQPLVLIEAMSLQKAIVATDVGGVMELLDSGSCGRIIPAGDAASLAAAIGSTRHSEQTVEMARRARIRYEQHHTPGTGLENWLTAYRAVLAVRSNASDIAWDAHRCIMTASIGRNETGGAEVDQSTGPLPRAFHATGR